MYNVILRPYAFQWIVGSASGLKRQHSITSLSRERLRRRNMMKAWVTDTGGLVFEIHGPIPDDLRKDLRHAFLCYIDKNGVTIGRANFAQWMADSASLDLRLDQHNGISVPLGTESIKVCLRTATGYIELCEVDISRDERLLGHCHTLNGG